MSRASNMDDSEIRHALFALRADDWLEQLSARMPSFERLSEVVGRRFLAFSLLADMRITRVEFDGADPDRSIVSFTEHGEGPIRALDLSAFRTRAIHALIAAPDSHLELQAMPSVDALRALIGPQFVYLAPMFGLRLMELIVHAAGGHSLRVEIGQASETLSLDDFREVLRDAVRGELVHVSQQAPPTSVDLGRIPEAERALEAGDHGRVVEILGSWLDPLSGLLRTPQGQALGSTERRHVVHAMGLLGRAYIALGHLDWADEVVRVGIQWARDDVSAAELFQCLGTAYVHAGRQGEAIGLLRRALGLGASAREVLVVLAQAFADRERFVAAVACLDDAEVAGAEPAVSAGLRARVEAKLGQAYFRYRSMFAVGSAQTREPLES